MFTMFLSLAMSMPRDFYGDFIFVVSESRDVHGVLVFVMSKWRDVVSVFVFVVSGVIFSVFLSLW